MNARRLVLAVLCGLAGGLLFTGSVAQAGLFRPFVSSFGSFSEVQGIAVEQSTGDVYVLDAGNHSVSKFDASGTPVDFSALGTNVIEGVGGAGNGENEIAVDNSSGPDSGDIYVANNSVVRIYGSTGTFLGELTGGETCGVAVGPAGTVYVGIYPETVRKYTPVSNPVTDANESGSMVGLKGICNVAADGAGDVYAATYTGGVSKYEASQFLITPLSASGTEFDSQSSTLAVDPTGNPSTEDVYLDEGDDVVEYNPMGNRLGSFGVGSLSESHGVAVNHASDDLYASNGPGQVDIFGPGVLAAEVTTGAVTEITETSATLNGTVNPGGLSVSTCEFEYGTQEGVLSKSVACSPAPGAGSNAVPVQADLTELALGKTYFFRLAAIDANATVYGQEESFTIYSPTIAGPPGLPDGRIYELVSPANKHGAEAGGRDNGIHPFMLAGVQGDEAAFDTTGPVGKTPTGYTEYSIARRSATGWQSHGALPRGNGTQELFFTNPQQGIGFSADMTATAFGANDVFVPEQEVAGPTPKLYVYGEDGEVRWIGKPTSAEPSKFNGESRTSERLAGASPDYKTVYLSFTGSLVPADEERNPALGGISHAEGGGAGFYEWHEGTLEAAGVLPDGHLDPYGAVPIVNGGGPEELHNQVSGDGREAFFLSPDPQSRSGRPSELYVRETAPDGTHSTALVSRDLQLAPAGEEPASDPAGPLIGGGGFYAAPDGSRVFFESTSQLTPDAPSSETVKAYEFDTDTNTLTYLPGVADLAYTACSNCALPTINLLRSSRDGSSLVFEREGQLDLWKGGEITKIGSLGGHSVSLVRDAANGSIYVFQTSAPFAGLGFNNDAGSDEEIYRYEVGAGALNCVSCPPSGTLPSGNAELSHDFSGDGNAFSELTPNRGVSEDGERVFFDTPDALVPQDTDGLRDVYEWEGGVLNLISAGVSTEDSFFGDNSPSGNDVFFSTTEGLVPGDADEGYDVYDARVPRPGDQLPPAAVPCEGAVCQGPPSVPQLLGQPSSETFAGAGNVTPRSEVKAKTKPKALTQAQKLTRALAACKKRSHKKRAVCEARARKRYVIKTRTKSKAESKTKSNSKATKSSGRESK